MGYIWFLEVPFNKPNSAITDKLYDFSQSECHYEGEISFLIKEGKIAGVGFGLDLTKRDLQSELKTKGLPWERAKAFDNSAVFSHFIPYDGSGVNLRMELWINDELKQAAKAQLMLYKPDEILKEIKSFMSLEDGDIIMSGTPKGVGRFEKGDRFIGKIFEDQKLLIQWEISVELYIKDTSK
jgi:2-keto-4-pentenoate hydratase/2-oxohepta-3-ene-1,7-dioic acid hydratase in catechol pathway